MKRGDSAVLTEDTRFTRKVEIVAKKLVVGPPATAVRKGEGRYADWVIVPIPAIRDYLDKLYRLLIEIIDEMSRVASILGLRLTTLPHYSTVYG